MVTEKRAVPENIEQAAITAANAAYGAVYGLDGDIDGDAGEDDPSADAVWRNTYEAVVEEMLEECSCANDLEEVRLRRPTETWSSLAAQLVAGGMYSDREESYLFYLAGERDQREKGRRLTDRATLERLLDEARDNDHPATSWMMVANDAISDHSLGVDASAYILQIAAARDKQVLETHNMRQNLLHDIDRTVGNNWYPTWAAVGEAVLSVKQDVPLDDAAWLMGELRLWDSRDALLSAYNRSYRDRLVQQLESCYDSDRSGHMTWSLAAETVIVQLGLDDAGADIVRKVAEQRQDDDEQYMEEAK